MARNSTEDAEEDEARYQAMKEREIARERELAAECEDLTARLLVVAAELHWHGYDPYEAAHGWIESARSRAGDDDPVPVKRARQRSKNLPSRAVWDRDGWRCLHCGSHQNLTVDHIVPWSAGGSDEMDNLQTLCGSCNSRKGDRQ